MTLNEAIIHAEEKAKEHERKLKIYEGINKDRPLFREEEMACKLCAEEHRQLVEWLKDYKRLLEQESKTKRCEDCKHFRKLPYHANTLEKCVHHTGFCPKGDWYCADFEIVEL